MMRWLHNIVAVAAVLIGLATISVSPAKAGPTCHGSFVNPITDVCWSCMFPLSLGGLSIWPSSRPDAPNPSLPLCVCATPLPRVGLSVGFWEPVRLIDATMKPFCFPNLGGLTISPGLRIGQKSMTTEDGNERDRGEWNIHWYAYPLLYWMEVVADFLCLQSGSFDIAYLSELDPLWQSDELTYLLNPEAILLANPLAVLACAGDCVAATVDLPRKELFWCAGCQGTMYPLNGNVSAQWGHVQGSRLAASRMAYKLHRQAIAWGTMGGEALCGKYLMPVMDKRQYRLQLINPNPSTSGRFACAPIGTHSQLYEAGKYLPVVGEDFGYLVWRKRNCCAL